MDKPFATIEEQVELLRKRGLVTDEATCSTLKREGYYQVVNGYKDLFLDEDMTRQTGEDRYASGASFADLRALFDFDRELRNTLFRYFSKAEALLKTVCSYHFAKANQGNAEAYLERSSYRKNPSYDVRIGYLLDTFKRILHKRPYNRRRGFQREYIRHYVEKHDTTPIWVLMHFLTLGQAFQFYDFQNDKIRNEIAQAFSGLYAESHPTPKSIGTRRLRLAFDHIKDFRNICAHDERLFCARVSQAKDTDFTRMIADLELVTTSDDFKALTKEVHALLCDLSCSLGDETTARVAKAMGLPQDFALFPMWETA